MHTEWLEPQTAVFGGSIFEARVIVLSQRKLTGSKYTGRGDAEAYSEMGYVKLRRVGRGQKNHLILRSPHLYPPVGQR